MSDVQYVISVNTKQAQASLNKLNASLGVIDRTAGLVTAALAGIITGGALRSIAQTTSRFQDLRTTLASVTGGAREGARAFEFIQDFSTRTQFGIEELTQTFIKLQGAGITPTEQLLTTFTDAAAVTTDQIGSLQAITDLFSRTVSGGLGLEELNRLADRGIPVFAILEEQIGLSRLEISEFGKTAEGARRITEALARGIEERFGGATAARLNNVSTQFSNLQIAITNASDAIGRQGFAAALGETATEITNILTSNEQLIQEIGVRLTQAFLIVKDAIVLLVANIEFLGKAFIAFFALGVARAVGGIALAFGTTLVAAIKTAGAAMVAFTAIVMRNPLIAAATVIVGGIEALTGAFSNLAKEMGLVDAAGEALEGIKDSAGDIAGAVGLNTDSFNEFLTSVRSSEQEALALQARLEELQNGTSGVATAMQNVEQSTTDTTGAVNEQLTSVQSITSELKTQKELQQSLMSALQTQGDFYNQIENSTQDLQLQLQKLNLDPLQQQTLDIDTDIQRMLASHQAQIRQLENSGEITAEMSKRLQKEAAEFAAKNLAEQQELAVQINETQRSFEYGWRQAFEEYEDSATNAAKRAEEIFEKTTKGMEDAIVGFAKTGRFEWRSFVSDILETILRSNIQQIIAQTFSMPSGGGSVGGGLGNLFAGFFANGGMIPAGQFGVVGERGPELISGPAQITPMQTGGNVTYNIQAVDAQSFKQLVARDPGFIHAVATQGGKAIPGGR